MAESTKGVEENDKGTEGKRGDIGARGETQNGGRKREEEKEDDDAKEEREERAAKGKSQATCTRQQPPTSEELIINLLSPSPNAAALTRPPSLHFHLRLSLSPTTPLSRPLRRPSFTLTYPSTLAPFLSLSSRACLRFPSSLSLSPPLLSFAHAAPGCVFTIMITRALAFAAFPHGLTFDLAPVLSTSKPCRYFRPI